MEKGKKKIETYALHFVHSHSRGSTKEKHSNVAKEIFFW